MENKWKMRFSISPGVWMAVWMLYDKKNAHVQSLIISQSPFINTEMLGLSYGKTAAVWAGDNSSKTNNPRDTIYLLFMGLDLAAM